MLSATIYIYSLKQRLIPMKLAYEKDDLRKGVRMHSMSHNNRFRREIAPEQEPWIEMGEAKVNMFQEQENQWAVLRHEVEGRDMKLQDERVRWERRDTEEDAIVSQSSFEALEQA